MTDRISQSPDRDKEFLEQIGRATSDFSNNPRDMKRFVNVLKFQLFVWFGIKEKTENEPCSFDQLRRGIVLSMKRPVLIRWLYWSQEGDQGKRRDQSQQK